MANVATQGLSELLRRKEYRSLPLSGIVKWDRVKQIDAMLDRLDLGDFRGAARFMDTVRRDERISGIYNTRVSALTGKPVKVTPGDDRSKSASIAELLEGREGMPGLWSQIFPASTVKNVLRWGLGLGIAVTQIVWDTSGDYYMPRLKVMHPENLEYRWDTQSYWYQAMDGYFELPRVDLNPHSDGQWWIWCPYGYDYAFQHGIVRNLAIPYLIRQWTRRDAARYSEVHGLPARVAMVPEGAKPEDKKKFKRSVHNIAAEPTVYAPQSKDGKGFDLQYREAVAKTWEIFEMLLDHVDSNLAVAITGQKQSTDGAPGLGAQEKPGEAVRLDILRDDAQIAQSMRDQVIYWWTALNFDGKPAVPYGAYQVDPPEDKASKAKMFVDLTQGLVNAQTAQAPVDARAVLEDAGIPTTEIEDDEDEELEEGAAPGAMSLSADQLEDLVSVNEARAAHGLGALTTPSGAPDPDGKLTVADFKAKRRPAPATPPPGAPPPPPVPEDEEPEAAAAREKTASIAAWAGTMERVIAGKDTQEERVYWETVAAFDSYATEVLAADRAERTQAQRVAVNRYPDQLTKVAVRRVRKALRGDLKSLMTIVRSAKVGPDGKIDGEDLKRRVIEQYQNSHPGAIARYVEKTRLMANLYGRYAALKAV